MAEISGFRIGNKNLTDILQDSENRSYVTFSDLKVNNNNIAVTKYDTNYTVFNEDMGINDYLKNSNTTVNKGALPKGYSPLLIARKFLESSHTYSVYYKGFGSPNVFGQMYVYDDSNGTYVWGSNTNPQSVPTVLILGLQGGGGGGEKGSGRENWHGGQGGGAGAFLGVLVKLPYNTTSFTKVFQVSVGSGGGSNGGGRATTLKTATGTEIAHAHGGYSGSGIHGSPYAKPELLNGFTSNSIFTSNGVQFAVIPTLRSVSFYEQIGTSGSYTSCVGIPGGSGEYWYGSIGNDTTNAPYLGITKSIANSTQSSYKNVSIQSFGGGSNKVKNGLSGAGSIYSSGGGYNSGGGSRGSGGGGGEAGFWWGSDAKSGGSGGTGLFAIYY